VIDVRHYLTRGGKDVFDDWLTRLKDARAQAKVAVRIDRFVAGNFGDCRPLRQGYPNYGSTGDRATAFISP
jgi:putative addiction module killer protein